MGKKKHKQKKKYNDNRRHDETYEDQNLPPAPILEIYQESFGGLKNMTDKWYKKQYIRY